jgi:hypothetical protein
MASQKTVSDIEKAFKISSPKPKPLNLDSEEEFNDFHYWQDPIMEVEELRRFDSTLPRNRLKVPTPKQLERHRLLDPAVGVNGTIRRVVEDNKPLEKVKQKDEPKIHSITNVYVIQSSSRTVEVPLVKPPVIRQTIAIAPEPKAPEMKTPVPILTPQIQPNLVILDGRVVDDGNFIHQQKYQYLVENKSKDDSNFIQEDRYMILPDGKRVPLAEGSSAPDTPSKPVEPSQTQDDAKRPMIHIMQPPARNATPRATSLPKRIDTGFKHSTALMPNTRSMSPRIPSGGRNSPPPSILPSVNSAPTLVVVPSTPSDVISAPVVPSNPLSNDGSHTTLNMEPIPTPAPKTKPDLFWWQKVQLLRAVAFGIYTFMTTIEGLKDMRVSKIGGRPLLYAILVFSGIDMLFAVVKAWPRKLWLFWDVRNWDAVFDSNLDSIYFLCMGYHRRSRTIDGYRALDREFCTSNLFLSIDRTD